MKLIRSPYRTDFYMWHGISALFFSSYVTDVHSHNTLQIFVDLHDNFKCKIGNGKWESYKSLVIKENVMHQLDTNGSTQLLIYLDKDTHAAKKLKTKYLGQQDIFVPDVNILTGIEPDVLQQTLLEPDAQKMLNIVNRVIEILCGSQILKSDKRISKARQLLAEKHPSELSVKNIADEVCLSESRVRALFKAETGIPLYNYIIWARIRYAVNKIINGYSVNEAALEAGFTDSSHFHKMMVKMFGINPSYIFKNNKSFHILLCDTIPLKFETSVYNKYGEVENIYR